MALCVGMLFGQSASAQDTTPPAITIIPPPGGPAFTQMPEGVWFQGTASDEGSPEPPQVTLRLRRVSDGQFWAGGGWTVLESFNTLSADYATLPAWSCSSPLPRIGPDTTRCLTAGEYELIATAQDLAGNEAAATYRFTVEHTLTLPELSFLTPQVGTTIPESGVTAQNGLTYPALPEGDQRDQTPFILRFDPAGNSITGVAMSLYIGQFITPHPSAAIHKHSAAGAPVWRLERERRGEIVHVEGADIERYYERFSEDQEWYEIDGYTYGGMYSLGAMELDAAGNVYAAFNLYQLQYRQYATSAGGTPLYANIATPVNTTVVVKFDPAGNLLWRRTVSPTSMDDAWYSTSSVQSIQPLADGSAVVLINNGQIYHNSFGPDISYTQSVLARVGTASGGFTKHFGYGSKGSIPLDIGLDAAGDLYLVSSEGPQYTNYSFRIAPYDHVIRKVSQTGTVLRELKLLHCDLPEHWTDMAVDPATGHLYIAGNHTISEEFTGRQIGLKFDLNQPEGQELLWRAFGPAASVAAGYPVRLALGAEGVFLGNTSRLGTSARNVVAVTRLSRAGAVVWSRTHGTPQQNFDEIGDTLEALSLDDTGNVYVLGFTPGNDGSRQSVVRKISSFGDVQFARLFPVGTEHYEWKQARLHLLPNAAAPTSIATLAQAPTPGRIVLFSNPDVVIPSITIPANDPADQVVSVGADATLAVHASGPAQLTYQWRRHTAGGAIENIPGATEATLTIVNAQLADAGQYSVVVSSPIAAPVTSRIATLSVETTGPGEGPLMLSINAIGNGAIFETIGKKLKPAASTSERAGGEIVKLVAKPAKGFLHAGWSLGSDPAIVSLDAAFTTTLSGNLALTAHFIPSPFPAMAGNYSGVIEGTAASAATHGGFTFTVNAAGKVTGKLTYGNQQIPLKLALDAHGMLHGSLRAPGGRSLDVFVQITSAGVTGSLSEGGATLAQFTGAKVLTFAKSSAPSVEGRYTLLLHESDQTGAGQALLQVAKNGKVKIAGTLAGGEPFVINTSLYEGNRVPVFLSLRKTGQMLIGWIIFVETPGVSDLQGSLLRFSPAQPAGVELIVNGSAQTATAGSWLLEGLEASDGAATLTFTGGGLPTPITQEITLSQVALKRGKVAVAIGLPSPNDHSLKLMIDPLTGLFSGKFKPIVGSSFVNFRGVLFQKQDVGEGSFENADQTGTVSLAPVSPNP